MHLRRCLHRPSYALVSADTLCANVTCLCIYVRLPSWVRGKPHATFFHQLHTLNATDVNCKCTVLICNCDSCMLLLAALYRRQCAPLLLLMPCMFGGLPSPAQLPLALAAAAAGAQVGKSLRAFVCVCVCGGGGGGACSH